MTLYKYDNNGNQLAAVHRKPVSGDEPEFHLDLSLGQNRLNENVVNHYDVQDQLSRVLTGNNKLSCQYDADGYRTSKTVNGTTTYFVWDDDQIVMELDGKGNVRKRYIRGNSLISADNGEGTDSVYYVMNDHGDVVQLLDKSGDVIREYAYDSFGNEINADKKDDNPFRYAGEYFDRETGNIYLRSRYYAPEQGRFLTMDTYTGEDDDPLSLHRYAYCDNDGVNQVDPSGQWGRKKGFGYKGDRFVHKSITLQTNSQIIAQPNFENRMPLLEGRKISGFKSGAELILDGSVLPDYIFERKKQKKSVYDSIKNKYGLKYHKRYRKYIKKRLLKEKIWNYDKYNGKTKSGQKKFLSKKFLNKFQGPYKKWEKYVLLGCVVHSIQDYQAHSLEEVDLATFRDTKNSEKKFSQKVVEFHSDWVVTGESLADKRKAKLLAKKRKKNKKAKLSREEKTKIENTARAEGKNKIHRNYKDNPLAAFTYDQARGRWVWVEVSSAKRNKRYVTAIANSRSYLDKVVKRIK